MTEVELSMRPILDEVNFFGELSEEGEMFLYYVLAKRSLNIITLKPVLMLIVWNTRL